MPNPNFQILNVNSNLKSESDMTTRPRFSHQVLIQSDKPKRRKKFSFPWWFVIVAWTTVVLTTAAATTFTVFYGIQFGDKETREFLASLFISFFTGLVLTQPIKVSLMPSPPPT